MLSLGRGRSGVFTCAPARRLQLLQPLPIRIALCALFLSGAAPLASARAATYTFTAAADTYTRSDAASSNYGTSTRISDRNASSQKRHTYLRFNVAVPVGETVTGATLKVYSTTSGSNVDLRDVASDSWSETGLTWNSAPVFGPSVKRVGSFGRYRTVSFDARQIVTGNGPASMALTTTSGSAISFYSRESGSNRPQLLVQTAVSAPDPAPDPAPTSPPPPAPEARTDVTAPDTTIASGPVSSTTSTTASFSFTGSDDTTQASALTFACSLDGAAFTACSSITTYGGLAVGAHTFAVRATDQAGNADGSPAQYSWSVTAPTPSPVLFSEGFDVANGGGGLWGTADWISNAVLPSNWHSDANDSTLLSVASSGHTSNVAATGGHTDMQRWWITTPFSGNVRTKVEFKQLGWDSTASSKSTWAAFTFYVRRSKNATEASFYGVSPYVYNGQHHIEKKCVAQAAPSGGSLSPFETGTVGSSKYAYYLLANSPSGVPLPAFNVWHDLAVTAEDQGGSVVLKVYTDGVLTQQVTDSPGLTGCAPLTGSGYTGFRSDSANYEIDNFTVEQLP